MVTGTDRTCSWQSLVSRSLQLENATEDCVHAENHVRLQYAWLLCDRCYVVATVWLLLYACYDVSATV